MSVSIAFGDGPEGAPGTEVQVATNKGWSDVVDWVEGLDPETYPELTLLTAAGECGDLPGLVAEIEDALRDDAPEDESVATTLAGLAEAVKARQDQPYVIVSDGFYSGYEDEDELPDGGEEEASSSGV
jgi:hypothetical protein